MPAYQLHIYEQQEEREVLEQKICEQVDACTEVNGTIRNRIKKFLIEEGITDISEMDAVLRVRCEEYLERNETVLAPITCLRGFDGIVIHRMKEELQTLAGHDLCSACVSSELSMAREVSNNNSRQNPQNNIQHDGCNVITDSGGIAFVTENCSVNEVSDNSGEKYHECVCDALNKSQSNHITVGNVSNFMSEHCFYFFFIHAGEKTG